jgi:hypothetical protein
VTGGDTPYLQQQYWPLDQLAGRAIPAIPAAPPATPPPPAVPTEAEEPEDAEEAASFVALLYQKAVAGGLYAEG